MPKKPEHKLKMPEKGGILYLSGILMKITVESVFYLNYID